VTFFALAGFRSHTRLAWASHDETCGGHGRRASRAAAASASAL
jgi:hypothetical protein